MLLIDHYVAKSTIHGLGVYSAEYVTKGQKVWEFHPAIDRIVPVEAFNGLPIYVLSLIESRAEYLKEQNAFLTSLDGDQFMNHSESPNTSKLGNHWFALKEIQPGDELTCDYRDTVILGFDPETGQSHPRMHRE